MCKAFGFELEQENEIAKSFGAFEITDIDMMIDGTIPVLESAKEAISYVQKYPELFEYVRKLTGLPKSFGLHACGKVISTRELDEFMPSCYDTNGIRYLQGDLHTVEDVGLVKIDLLGLRTLDHIYDALEEAHEDRSFINTRQDYTDPSVLRIFKRGDTEGVFQFASYGMRNTLKKMSIYGIEELAAANALYRPGAMDHIDDYCRRSRKLDSITYLHPDLEPILGNTYGVIVFQEQLIDIGRMAGMRNPDLLRRATAKKEKQYMDEVMPELESLLLGRGWTQDQFDELWKDMLEFAKYSFGKAHACAYSSLAFDTAKLKAYHPAEFYCGLFNSYIGDSSFAKDVAEPLMTDAYVHKVKLESFNFRNDHRKCNVKNGKLYYGVPLIRDCSVSTGEALYSIRNTDKKYFWSVLQDFIAAGAFKSHASIMIQLGFFNEFGTPKQLLNIMSMLVLFTKAPGELITQIKKAKIEGNEALYAIVAKHGSDTGANGKQVTSFRELDVPAILNECEDYIKSIKTDQDSFKVRAETHRKYLGFAPIASGLESERPILVVRRMFPALRRKDKVQFGYNITTCSFGSGIQGKFTVMLPLYNKEPINEGDIIHCLDYTSRNGYLTMTAYKRLE